MSPEIRSLIKEPTKKVSKPIEETKYQRAWRHVKVITIYTLVLATAAGFLLFHMEKKARTMEREEYKRQVQELKDEANKAQEKLETSLLTERSQPNQ
jgi:uncharacterized protein YlxW (UPF0749 family)